VRLGGSNEIGGGGGGRGGMDGSSKPYEFGRRNKTSTVCRVSVKVEVFSTNQMRIERIDEVGLYANRVGERLTASDIRHS
jgi:hypothetical protein